MTWTFASLALLGLALAAGFAWYERTAPTPKVVALVATLAALAALGRIAFAPLPNVKPTTDIVLIAGYALGGAPGFVVGAVSAVASNLFFGQGPWTPWQMGAWGLVGVLGAGLAAVTGRRLGRVGLAVACGLAGALFGAIQDLSLWTQYSGSHTLGQFVAISSTSLAFNVAHVVGNVVFFLAFGPALVRALERFRVRFAVRWEPVVAGLAALTVLAAAPTDSRADAADRAAGYLAGAQNRDGGWGPAPGARSSALYTGWSAIGLAAARLPSGAGRYVAGHLGEVRSVADAERTVLALHAAGATVPTALVARIRGARRPNGSVGGQVNVSAFAILSLRAAGAPPADPVVRGAGRWIARQSNRDGGFNFYARGAASGIDDTGGAVQALAAAGRGASSTVRRATAFLRRERNRDGGWPLAPGGASNAQSTAWALQALVAGGRGLDPRGVAYLRSLQAADGSIRYSRASRQTPVWVTAQALAALRGAALPVAPSPAVTRPQRAERPATPPIGADGGRSPRRPAPGRRAEPRAARRATPMPRLTPRARTAGFLCAVLLRTARVE